jgi:hypothetical protein
MHTVPAVKAHLKISFGGAHLHLIYSMQNLLHLHTFSTIGVYILEGGFMKVGAHNSTGSAAKANPAWITTKSEAFCW